MNVFIILLLIAILYLFFRARPWRHGIEKFFKALATGILVAMSLNLVIYLTGNWFDLDRSWIDPLNIIVLIVGIAVAAYMGTLVKKQPLSKKNASSPGK